MIVSHLDEVKGIKIENKEAKGVVMKVLISPNEGWEGYVMREFEVDEGGHTPRHSHPWPHINYFISGEGELYLKGEKHKLKPGGFSYIPANTEHQFRNIGKEKFRFICIVPKDGHK